MKRAWRSSGFRRCERPSTRTYLVARTASARMPVLVLVLLLRPTRSSKATRVLCVFAGVVVGGMSRKRAASPRLGQVHGAFAFASGCVCAVGVAGTDWGSWGRTERRSGDPTARSNAGGGSANSRSSSREGSGSTERTNRRVDSLGGVGGARVHLGWENVGVERLDCIGRPRVGVIGGVRGAIGSKAPAARASSTVRAGCADEPDATHPARTLEVRLRGRRTLLGATSWRAR